MKKTTLLLAILALMISPSCEKDYAAYWTYHPPVDMGDGLAVGTLSDAGIDYGMINKAIGRIGHGKYNEIHALLIYRDDMLVFESYYPGHQYKWDGMGHLGEWVEWDETMLHDIHSVSKSITGLCVLLGVDHGYIKSLNQSIFDYLPEHQAYQRDGREHITIQHLLTMTSGIHWPEWSAAYSSTANPVIGIWFSELNPIDYIFQYPMTETPGSKFNYSGGDIILLGEILSNASGMDIDKFSLKYLFNPIGIDTTVWTGVFSDGTIECAGTLMLRPRDLLKVGVTCLQNGRWNGQQVLSEEWIDKISTPYGGNQGINIPGKASGKHGYAYTFWTHTSKHGGREIEMYSGVGWGGQDLIIIPELNTVVVFHGANYTRTTKEYEILERFIIPAIL